MPVRPLLAERGCTVSPDVRLRSPAEVVDHFGASGTTGVVDGTAIDADTHLVGRPLSGNRNDCRARADSGAKAAVGKTMTIADGGYRGTGLVIPHRRRSQDEELHERKQAHNRSHKQVRARVKHAFARINTWKILRDCRLRGDGLHPAMSGIAPPPHLARTGQSHRVAACRESGS